MPFRVLRMILIAEGCRTVMPRDFTSQTRHQRSNGDARVSFGIRAGKARLRDLRQQGSAKAILPHAGDVPEVVFLNTSGGLTGGDRLSYSVKLDDGVHVVATTQAAERAYRSDGGRAEVDVRHEVGADGWLDWLPQETILFDGAALHRRTEIDLASGAGCLVLEAVVLGRKAMGETVRRIQFTDHRQITRAGKPVHIEPLVLTDSALAAGDAVLGGARAFASIVMVDSRAADRLEPLRRVLDEPGTRAHASAFDGRLCVRIMAADGYPMRRQILRALTVLRQAPLPRVWQM